MQAYKFTCIRKAVQFSVALSLAIAPSISLSGVDGPTDHSTPTTDQYKKDIQPYMGASSTADADEGGIGEFLSGLGGCDPATKANQAEEAQKKGDPKSKTEIMQAQAYLTSLEAQCPAYAANLSACKVVGAEAIKAAAEKYSGSWERCHDTQNKAAAVCLECNNGSLAGTLSNVNTLLSGMGAMGVNDQCSKMGKAFNIASMALTAYTTSCGVIKSGCGVICYQSTSGLKSLSSLVKKLNFVCTPSNLDFQTGGQGLAFCNKERPEFEKMKAQLDAAVVAELKTGTLGSVAGKGERCTREYGKLVMSALAGAAQMMAHAKQSKECEKKTEGAEGAVAAAKLDCKDSKNASLPECICELNPRNPGCNNSLTKAGSDGVSFDGRMPSNTDIGVNAADKSGALTAASGGGGINSKMSDVKGGAGQAPGAGGGGAGLGGSAAGVDGAVPEEGIAAAAEYGMEMGTGGGGGGWGGGGLSSSEKDGLKDYLPGGENDPNAMAGEEFPTDVTTEGGKSNWEKVRDRYSDNKRTLLNN